MRTITAQDIRRLRLKNLWLAPRPNVTPKQITEHLGALQAQEIWSGSWSIGARGMNLSVDAVNQACEDAEILRTWPLRNTVHFVPSADAHWMLDVAQSFAYKSLENRRAHLGLSESNAHKACEVLASALADGEPVPRETCLKALEDAGLLADKSHGYHLLWFAAQQGVSCIGPQRGSTQTFVNLDAWVSSRNTFAFVDAVGELARRYFTSHGPALVTDFKRWTGLTMRECRAGIALAGDAIGEVATEVGTMWMGAQTIEALDNRPVDAPETSRQVLLLSGFDEYVLGYGDRQAIMAPDALALVVPGNNGMFRPTIVDDGQIIGVWKRKVTAKRVELELDPFSALSKSQRSGVERAAGEYGEFLGLEPVVRDRSRSE